MTDPETKAAAAKATGAKALAAQTQSRTQTGKGSGANVLCRRCWDRGHVIKDCPQPAKVCTACDAHGAFLACGGEYKPDKCMVMSTSEEVAEGGWRKAIIAYRESRKSLIEKGVAKAKPKEGADEGATALAAKAK